MLVTLILQSSLVRTATCQFALENFPEAYALLKEALVLSRGATISLADHHLVAEILNNLGCLAYLNGQTTAALEYFEESLETQSFAAEHSLYVGSKFSSHQGSLNASITRGNIGFVALVSRNISDCLSSFESSLKVRACMVFCSCPSFQLPSSPTICRYNNFFYEMRT